MILIFIRRKRWRTGYMVSSAQRDLNSNQHIYNFYGKWPVDASAYTWSDKEDSRSIVSLFLLETYIVDSCYTRLD